MIDRVRKKQKIEKNFLKVKRVQSGVHLSTTTLIFGVSATLMIIGLVTTPFSGAGLILLLLRIGSFAISLGLMGGGYYYAYQKKPGLTAAYLKGVYLRLLASRSLAKIHAINESIGNYVYKTYQEKREQLAHHISQLPLIHRFFAHSREKDEFELKEFIANSKEIELEFHERQSKSKRWKDKAIALHNEWEEIAWNDFAEQTHLQVAPKSLDQPYDLESDPFDTLEELNHALNQADFNLLSSETKELLEKQLGINVSWVQTAIEKDPSKFKQLLRNFFNLSDTGYLKFIGEQKFMKQKTF